MTQTRNRNSSVKKQKLISMEDSSVFGFKLKKIESLPKRCLSLLLCHPASMFSLFHSRAAVFSVSHKKVTVFSLFHNQATVFSLSCERLTNWTGTSDTSVSTLLIGFIVKDNSSVRVKWFEFEFWVFDWTSSAKALFRQQKWAIFLVSMSKWHSSLILCPFPPEYTARLFTFISFTSMHRNRLNVLCKYASILFVKRKRLV